MTYCFEHKIYLFQLPAHTSLITQPLDVRCFAPLKTYYQDRGQKLCREGSLGVTKAAFIDLYYNTRVKAMTKANIEAGWSVTGLNPFNKDKILSQYCP